MAEHKLEILIRAKDEATRIIREVAAETGSFSSTVTKLAGDLGIAGAAVAGIATAGAAVVGVASKFADTALQLDKLAKNTGVSTQNLQVLNDVLESFGIEQGAANTALFMLNRQIALGNPLLAKYGVTSKDTFTAFQQLADKLKDVSPAERADASMRLLGRSAKELQAAFTDLNPRIKESQESLGAKGVLFSDEAIQNGVKMWNVLDDLRDRFKGLTNQTEVYFLPAAIKIVDGINHIAEAANNAARAYEKMRQAQESLSQRTADFIARYAFGKKSGYGGGASWTDGPEFTDEIRRQRDAGNESSPPPDGTPYNTRGYLQVTAAARKLGGLTGGILSDQADSNQQLRGDTIKSLSDKLREFAKSLEAVDEPATRLTPDIQRMQEALQTFQQRAVYGVVASIDGAIGAVLSGTQSITSAFRSLIDGILQSIAQSAAEYGIGLGLSFLGTAIGGPVGGFITTAGNNLAGARSAGRAGGATYISAIDTQSFIDARTRPSGGMRSSDLRLAEMASFSGA